MFKNLNTLLIKYLIYFHIENRYLVHILDDELKFEIMTFIN